MPGVAQIALCSSDLPRSVQLYSEVLGFADAGGKALWGPRVASIQGLGDDASFVLWWLVGRQDLMQLEFFHHSQPVQRPQPSDWRPSDLGWSRFGVAVPDFDGVLERLRGLGIATLSDPMTHEGLRRVAFRDPQVGVVVEVMEEGAALPGGIRPRFYDLEPAIVYAALSVPDLGPARTFYLDVLGLEEVPADTVHTPEHEALWGLAGARREVVVARGGDVDVELVRYDDPLGRPKPEGYRLSDQGFMNIALGFRDPGDLQQVYGRFSAGGYHDNHEPPTVSGGTYVNDAQGNSMEMLLAPRELDPSYGFEPLPGFRRKPSWPRASVPAVRP